MCFFLVSGSGVGYYIFGAVNARNQAKFSTLQSTVYDKHYSNKGVASVETSVSTSSIR